MKTTSIKQIVLIDDDEVTNMINEKLIKKVFNFPVDAYTDANELLQHVTSCLAHSPEKLPDVIFLDINMPMMDGWEFLEEFEKIPQEARKKCNVIMLTSSIDTSDIEKSKMYSSVTDFISKPLTVEKLKSLVAA
jgi:CheY-like chemotaxis protein